MGLCLYQVLTLILLLVGFTSGVQEVMSQSDANKNKAPESDCKKYCHKDCQQYFPGPEFSLCVTAHIECTCGGLPTNKPPTNKPPTNKPPTNKPSTNKPPTNKPPTNKPPTNKPPLDTPEESDSHKPNSTTTRNILIIVGAGISLIIIVGIVGYSKKHPGSCSEPTIVDVQVRRGHFGPSTTTRVCIT